MKFIMLRESFSSVFGTHFMRTDGPANRTRIASQTSFRWFQRSYKAHTTMSHTLCIKTIVSVWRIMIIVQCFSAIEITHAHLIWDKLADEKTFQHFPSSGKNYIAGSIGSYFLTWNVGLLNKVWKNVTFSTSFLYGGRCKAGRMKAEFIGQVYKPDIIYTCAVSHLSSWAVFVPYVPTLTICCSLF